MPLYEFNCKSCTHHFEALVRSSDKVVCPKCESAALEKAFSSFAVKHGGSSASYRAEQAAAACGSCGDPRGPGACQLD